MKTLTEALLRRWPLPKIDGELGKESRGTLLVIGGSREVPGAALLAGMAALRSGAGRVQLATPSSIAVPLGIALPEAAVTGLRETAKGEIAVGAERALAGRLEGADAVLMGPGMSDERALKALVDVHFARNDHAPVVLDAGALKILAKAKYPRARKAENARVIVTPHAGEMAKLCGVEREDVLERPEELALETAAKHGIVLALKNGPRTFIASPDGELLCNTGGNLGLGTSGSGDALSGIITGLCARGATPMQATAWGVFLHARAGDVLGRRLGILGFLAREIAAELPSLLAALGRRKRSAR